MSTRTTWVINAAAILALGFAPAPLLAKPTVHAPILPRKVVLMDFTRAPEPVALPAPSGQEEPALIEDVARRMDSSFTNSSDAAFDGPAPREPVAVFSASSLPNPFITRAIAPFGSIPSPSLHGGGSCENYTYQDDFSHGRAAAERRRLIFPLVHRVACEQGLPIGLFDALIMQESRYQHTAISPKGALGLAQLMPGTARELGTNPYAVMDNLRGGARYLRQQVDRFGNYNLALAAYNAGPGRVARNGRIPAIAETIGYVRNISSSWNEGGRFQLASNVTPVVSRKAQLVFMPYYDQAASGFSIR